jgi:hypothetical protein
MARRISFPWAVVVMLVIASFTGWYIWLFANAIDFSSYEVASQLPLSSQQQ